MVPKERDVKGQATIEIANSNHIPAIMGIEEKTWISTYPNEHIAISKEDVEARFSSDFKTKRAREIETELADSNHSYRVLVVDGKVVGYSHLLKEVGYNDFVELYILAEYQGKGYGGLMMRDGLGWLGEEGKPIQLEVATHNLKAKAIYEHFGFKEDPTLKQAEGEDWNVLPSGKRIPVVFMVLS